MTTEPEFLRGEGLELPDEDVFRPFPGSRRGEFIAWACAAAILLLAFVFVLRLGRVPALTGALAAVFAVSGALISFGNWVDRHTNLILEPEGVRFSSPLRRVELRWREIESVWAVPVRRGWRIVISGSGKMFQFRTASPEGPGEFRLRIGFPQGEGLAAAIRTRAGLAAPVQEGRDWVARRE